MRDPGHKNTMYMLCSKSVKFVSAYPLRIRVSTSIYAQIISRGEVAFATPYPRIRFMIKLYLDYFQEKDGLCHFVSTQPHLLVHLSLQIFTLKFSLINQCIVKVVPPKSCLALLKMADKISMSQRALSKVSQRYIPHNVTFKNDRNGLHFMTGASLRLGPGKQSLESKFICCWNLFALRSLTCVLSTEVK